MQVNTSCMNSCRIIIGSPTLFEITLVWSIAHECNVKYSLNRRDANGVHGSK